MEKYIVDIKVLGLEKIAGKRYEFVLRLRWSNNTEATIYRPHSMFFDFQSVLSDVFGSDMIPSFPVVKFHWALLKKLGQNEKEAKGMEEFCMKIIRLPPTVSQAAVVLHFFETWGTDHRTNKKASELFDPGVGRASIQSTQERRKSNLTLSDDKDDQYKIVANYEAVNIGEISLQEGKCVTIIEKNERGWWFIADDAGHQGWAPATYLEPISSDDDGTGYDWQSVVDVNGQGEQYISVVAYTAQNNDELSYPASEEIEVLEKSNYGWWRVRIDGKLGITPATNLQRVNDTCLYQSADELKSRTVSISSASGLYAVIRKPPPRKESVRSRSSSGISELPSPASSLTKNGLSGKKPSRFVYSAASFAGGKFVIGEEDKESQPVVSNIDMRRSNSDYLLSQTSETYENVGSDSLKTKPSIKSNRSQSTGDALRSINLNQFPAKAQTPNGHAPYTNRSFSKPGEGGEVEFYSALDDYTPSNPKKDDLCLTKGEIVQLIASESSWMFVMRITGDIDKQGWVPETYLERRYDVDLQELTAKEGRKPKPRPRPLPRPKAKTQEPNNNNTHTVLTPSRPAPPPPKRTSLPEVDVKRLLPSDLSTPRPSLPDISMQTRLPAPEASTTRPEVSKTRPDVNTTRPQNPPASKDVSTTQPQNPTESKDDVAKRMAVRPPMPAPLLDEIQMIGKDEEDVYDEPETTLRSVYDAECWYFGKISRTDCERILGTYGRQKEFLVRESQRALGSYAISVKYCYRIRHFGIELTEDNQLMIGMKTFPNLMDIVNHYQQYALFYSEHKDHITLGQPFSKARVPK